MIVEATGYELEPTPWATRAACAGTGDPNLFFPGKGASTAAARAVCADCPVRTECLEYAVRWRIPHGVWGGATTRQRQRLYSAATGRPRRLPPPHGTTSRYHVGCRCQRCTEAQMVYLEDSRTCP